MSGQVIALDEKGRDIWQYEMRGPIHMAPTITDLNNDGKPEVLVANRQGQIRCLDGAGGNVLWEAALPAFINWGMTEIAVSDLDGDGKAEAVTGDREGSVLCVNADGTQEWLYKGDHGETLCPALADLDGDGPQEVVVGGTQVPLVCLDANGKELWRLDAGSRGSSPIVCNLDGKGSMEIVVGIDQSLAAVDHAGKLLWTQPMHDTIDSAISAADVNGDGAVEIVAVDLSGYAACVSSDGKLLWSGDVEERARRSPSIGDVDGDGEVEILIAGYSGAIHVFGPDGKLEERIALEGSPNATATLARFDDGGLYMICPTDSLMQVYRWPDAKPDATMLWPEYRFNSARTGTPELPASRSNVRIARIDFGERYVGSNAFSVTVENPDAEPLERQTGDRRESARTVASGRIERGNTNRTSNAVHNLRQCDGEPHIQLHRPSERRGRRATHAHRLRRAFRQ